jgi:hypothetical protein
VPAPCSCLLPPKGINSAHLVSAFRAPIQDSSSPEQSTPRPRRWRSRPHRRPHAVASAGPTWKGRSRVTTYRVRGLPAERECDVGSAAPPFHVPNGAVNGMRLFTQLAVVDGTGSKSSWHPANILPADPLPNRWTRTEYAGLCGSSSCIGLNLSIGCLVIALMQLPNPICMRS